MNKKFVILGILFALFAFTLAGCGNKPIDTNTDTDKIGRASCRERV